jgi:hypothetical protein
MRSWLRALVAVYMIGVVFLIGTVPPAAAQVEEDPIVRCFRTQQRSARQCYLIFENQIYQIGGAAAVSCLAGFLGGSVPLAVIICLVALGISLLVALNLAEQYNLCLEQAQSDYEVCVEVNCT